MMVCLGCATAPAPKFQFAAAPPPTSTTIELALDGSRPAATKPKLPTDPAMEKLQDQVKRFAAASADARRRSRVDAPMPSQQVDNWQYLFVALDSFHARAGSSVRANDLWNIRRA